ncbi:hypothetical protein [Actinophytocola sp.]|uniref:hypothetical protein n=1 Tax=Actinophytocola sp. TaxID=1872138 RepID=UPI003D6C1D73
MIKRISAIIGIVAVLSVAFFGATASATTSMAARSKNVSGSPPGGLSCSDGRGIGVNACFQPNGDKFWIKDYKADGHHVEVSFDSDRLEIGSCRDFHGKKAGWTVCDQFSRHISENQGIVFQGLVMEGSRILARAPLARGRT